MKSTPRKFFGLHHDFGNCYGNYRIYESQMITVITVPSFFRLSWFVTRFLAWLIHRVPPVEQEQLTLLEFIHRCMLSVNCVVVDRFFCSFSFDHCFVCLRFTTSYYKIGICKRFFLVFIVIFSSVITTKLVDGVKSGNMIWSITIFLYSSRVSKWMIVAIFRLYHGENKLIFNEMIMRFALY